MRKVEEVIDFLKSKKKLYSQMDESDRKDYVMECLDTAINLLSNKTDGDLISRQAVNKLRKYNLVGGVHTVSLDDINKLPSAKVDGDLISRKAVIDVVEREQFKGDAISEIEKLPSAEKTAKWKKEEGTKTTDLFRCSRCGRSIMLCKGSLLKDYPYCHCGAKMKESEEEE